MNGAEPLLDQRAALIFLLGLAVGLGTGILTVLAGGTRAGAVLAGGAAFGAAVVFFQGIVG
jgi:hypothetical protein